jgi:hypothetical protein
MLDAEDWTLTSDAALSALEENDLDEQTALTDRDGRYEFSGLRPGQVLQE